MDALVIVRAGDRTAAVMVDAVTGILGDRPTVVHTGGEAELALRARARDLVVVDPEVSAITPAGGGATGGPAVVGWLTARSSARVAEMLDAGASDVLDAAMGAAELTARLRRVIRDRAAAPVASAPLAVGGLVVDSRLREASWDGVPLGLTPREIEVLQVLLAAGGATVARDVIYRQVWRWAMPRGDRTVDVNVKRLRGKLAAAGVAAEVVTQPGVGYQLRVGEPRDRTVPPVVTGL